MKKINKIGKIEFFILREREEWFVAQIRTEVSISAFAWQFYDTFFFQLIDLFYDTCPVFVAIKTTIRDTTSRLYKSSPIKNTLK